MSIAYSRIQDALTAHGCRIDGNQNSNHIKAICPNHDDNAASLSITNRPDKGDVLISCMAHCPTPDVLGKLGLRLRDLYDESQKPQLNRRSEVVAEYDYRDEDGTLVYTVKRLEPGLNGEKKSFLPYLPGAVKAGLGDAPRILYNLQAVAKNIKARFPVYIVEGEKDVETLRDKGIVATTMPGGVGQGWRDSYTTSLHDAIVYIISDNDEPGIKHANQIASRLSNNSIVVRGRLLAKEGKDATDHFNAGFGINDFVDINAQEERKAKLEKYGGRLVNLKPASEIKTGIARWLWEGRIPKGTMTLTPGVGGIGKSLFHVWLIANLTNGSLPGIYYGESRPCIIAATEDSWEFTIGPRLLAANANLDLVYHIEVEQEEIGDVMLSLPRDVAQLEEAIADMKVVMLSLDPLMGTIGGNIDTHKDRDVRIALDPLVRLADKTGCSIIGNAHWNKSSGDSVSRITGSSAFNNVVRATLTFARDTENEEETYVITQTKNNLGRVHESLAYSIETAYVETDEGTAESAKLTMLGESSRSVDDIIRNSTSRGISDRSQEIVDFVNKNDGFTTPSDVAESFNISPANASTYLIRLTSSRRIEKEGRGRYRRCVNSVSSVNSVDSVTSVINEQLITESESHTSHYTTHSPDESVSSESPDIPTIPLDSDTIDSMWDDNDNT